MATTETTSPTSTPDSIPLSLLPANSPHSSPSTSSSTSPGVRTSTSGQSQSTQQTSTSSVTKPEQTSVSTHHAASTTPGVTFTPSSNVPKQDGLSTGASIGIGIAIAVFVLGVLCALGFFWYRRRSRTRQGDERGAETPAREPRDDGRTKSVREKIRGEKGEHTTGNSTHELSGKSKTGELETNANRHELDTHRRAERRHELPGDHGYHR